MVGQRVPAVRPRRGDLLTRSKPRGALDGEVRPLDVRRVMRLEQERPLAHPPHPLLGGRRRLQESPRPLDRRQPAVIVFVTVNRGASWGISELSAEGAVLGCGQ
jgi:hypothetical protein